MIACGAGWGGAPALGQLFWGSQGVQVGEESLLESTLYNSQIFFLKLVENLGKHVGKVAEVIKFCKF